MAIDLAMAEPSPNRRAVFVAALGQSFVSEPLADKSFAGQTFAIMDASSAAAQGQCVGMDHRFFQVQGAH